LEKKAKEHTTLLCLGLDPVLDRFPESIQGSTKERIVNFYSSILDSLPKNSISALKPNYAFYAQYGFDGLYALKELIDRYKDRYTIILDAKRGDIGKTSAAYAKEAYEFWEADSLTISGFMGLDSISPYFEHLEQGRGIYMLCRTSNEGANDLLCQTMADGKPFYSRVIKKAIDWHKDGLGLVVGATDIADLESILHQISVSKKRFPLLIPGVGSQGGSAKEVRELLDRYPNLLKIARINASSSIAYAYQKQETEDYIEAAINEISELNKDLGL
jgi:orotidine-5'-phosphate decarboxylase